MSVKINFVRGDEVLTTTMSVGRTMLDAAKKLKMSTLVLSVLTNYAAGLDNKTLKHEDVLLNAKKAQKNFIKLVKNIILDIGTEWA